MGFDDLIVGEPDARLGPPGQSPHWWGQASLYLGSPSGPATTPAWVQHAGLFQHFGASVAAAGDVNGDGYDDVVVGAPGDSGINPGRAYLYLGSAGGLATIPAWTGSSQPPSTSLFGAAVAGAGDVNGDGHDDVLVGEPNFQGAGCAIGRADLYLGTPDGLSASPVWIKIGDGVCANLQGTSFGCTVAAAGDVNGDPHGGTVHMPFHRSAPGLFRASVFALALGALHSEMSGGVQAALTLEPVLSGLASPVFVTHAFDGSGRLFVLEQAGLIKVLQPDGNAPTVFLDIRSKVSFGGERGLLGLAFHPGYETNRRFFVNYTRLPDGATIVAEYHASAANPNVADSTETVLLTIAQPFANHNGGMIAFGQDGYLYIAMGDGGSANDPGDRAQNVDDLLGKILRIDVDHPASVTQLYSSPADNPFAGPIAGRDEIYAWGFRNPWRFSFDRQAGDLLAGDVGQSAREEIDVVVKGGNYGWRTFEGTLCTGLDPPPCDPTPFVMPITEYGHSGSRCSVTGGYVYRGSLGTFPPGSYLFGDYCSGELFLIDQGQVGLIAATGRNISSFGEDQDGELYVVDHGGAVLRLAGDTPCVVSVAPASIAFTAAGGSGAVNVSAGDGCDWTVSTTDPWITITDSGSGSGDGIVRYSVAPNTDARSRTGSVRIGSQVHIVAQQPLRPCAVDVSQRIVLVGPLGGSGTLSVKANGACFWSATSLVPWITLTADGSGFGSGAVQYRVDSIPNRAPRFGSIRIGSRTIVVLQRAF